MKKTTLHKYHSEILNAKMASFAGFDMPLQYSSAKQEINAVRNNAGIFDVSHMGEFFVTGPEVTEFINYVITNDYSVAPQGKAVYSPICNEKGTIIDDLIVYNLQENKSLICVNAANIETDWNWIKSHSGNFKVNLEDKSDEISLIALQGPDAEKILTSVFTTYASRIRQLPYYGVFEDEKEQVIIARTGYIGEDGFEVFIPNKNVEDFWRKLLECGATPCGLASRDTLRLEVCYPLYGKELSLKHNPRESALAWTLTKDPEKPYLGRQAIEGKNDSRLIKLSLEKLILREGYKVFSGEEEIGFVTSGTFSPTLSHGIAIARVKKIQNIENHDLLIEVRGKKYPAKFHKQAFYAGGIKK